MKLAAEVLHNTRIKKYPNGKVHITVFSKDVYTQEGYELLEEKEKEEREKKEYNLEDPRADNMRREGKNI